METTSPSLSDLEVLQFIQKGFLLLSNSIPDELNKEILHKCKQLDLDDHQNPGNNILHQIPELNKIWSNPSVVSTLTSLLGENYSMSPHRYCHKSSPGFPGQPIHQDDYASYTKTHNHTIRWLVAFYYPQPVTLENGPTSLYSGSQYFSMPSQKSFNQGGAVSNLPEEWKTNEEKIVSSTPGSIVFFHYNIWHKGGKNSSQIRFGIKFNFFRVEEPTKPMWNHSTSFVPSLNPIHQHCWNWLCCGNNYTRKQATDSGISEVLLKRILQSPNEKESEPTRVEFAYQLAKESGGYEMLLSCLYQSSESLQRSAAYGLTSGDPQVVEELILNDLLNKRVSPTVERWMAFVLGEIGSVRSFAALRKIATNGVYPRAQRDAIEALTLISSRQQFDPTICQVLQELFEAKNQGSEFRQNIVLFHLFTATPERVSTHFPFLRKTVESKEVYVRGFSVLALIKLNSSESTEFLTLQNLSPDFCPLIRKGFSSY